MSETPATRPAPKQRTYRKNQFLFALIGKMKLWPSRKGILHGIRTMEIAGDHAVITTHCGRTFTAVSYTHLRRAPSGTSAVCFHRRLRDILRRMYLSILF